MKLHFRRISKPIAIIIACSLLAAIIGIPTALILRAAHQKQLNHALIDAIEASDTPAALAALKAGANPDSRMYQFGDTIVEEGEQVPTALIITLVQGDPGKNQTSNAQNRKEPMELVKALLDKGANPHLVDEFRVATPLLYAAEAGYDNCVRLLLQHGADVNVKGSGESPLFVAAINNHPSTVQLLLDYGANVNIDNGDGTVLEFIDDLPNIRPEIKAILRKSGAKTSKERDAGAKR